MVSRRQLELRLKYWNRRVRYHLKGVRGRQTLNYITLAELARRYDVGQRTATLAAAEYKVFSQNGEDGVICALMNALGPGSNSFVEFGIGAGIEGNCIFLADVLGWSGLFIESDPASFDRLQFKYSGSKAVRTLSTFVTPENLDRIVLDCGLPKELDILSIDIDGNDLWVWKGVGLLQPRVVIIEYNGDLPIDVPLVQPSDHAEFWKLDNCYGASLAALERVGAEKGYRLVYTELVGSNAFFVRSDLALDLENEPARRVSNQFLIGGRHSPGNWQDLMEPYPSS